MKTQKFTDICDGYVIEIRSYKKYDNRIYPAHPLYQYSRWQLLKKSIYQPQPQHKSITSMS